MEKPQYKGTSPVNSGWLDEETYVIEFETRYDAESECYKEFYAEVHLDEDNKVVFGVNYYEVDQDEYGDKCVGDYIEYEVVELEPELAKQITEYALHEVKFELPF